MKIKVLPVLPYLVLWFFMFLGGLWNAQGKFQYWMINGAPWVLLILSAAVLFYWARAMKADLRKNFLIWSISVFVLTWALEVLGVHTGFPFGKYYYGEAMKPLIFSAPPAIGAAWLVMMLSSLALSRKIFPALAGRPSEALSAAALMTLFDFFLEAAAPRLKYWHWMSSDAPFQNYISWFVISYLILYFGIRKIKITDGINLFALQTWIAQMLYFALSMMGRVE